MPPKRSKIVYPLAGEAPELTMDDRSTGRCERCGNTRAGGTYSFRYGKSTSDSAVIAASPTSTTRRITTRYEIHGPVAVFICDQCIADRRRKARTFGRLFGGVVFLMGALFAAGFIAGGNWVLAVIAPLFLGAIGWAVMRDDTTPEGVGEQLALEARREGLWAQGWTTFWDSVAYAELQEQSQRDGS